MLMTALLLVVIWALLVGFLAILHICDDPLPPAVMPSVPDTLDTHQAVMTLWRETQWYLDELERAGTDVTAARQHLRQTVQTLLASGLRHQEPHLNKPGSQTLAAPDTPTVVGRFVSLRIFG